MPELPAVSVIIPAVNERELLDACLAALEAQPHPERLQVVVVERDAVGLRDGLKDHALDLHFVDGSGLTIPQMRSLALEHCTAPVIAILEDHTNVTPTWLDSMLRGHAAGADVVGGSITNGAFSAVDWAAFLLEYHTHMTPLPEGPAPSLAGNNVSYKRSAIEQVDDLFRRGEWDTVIHEEMARQGHVFRCEHGAEVIHAKPFTFSHFATQRWHLARSFAGLRAKRFPAWKRAVFACGSPLLVPVLSWRIGRRLWARRRDGYLGPLLRAGPLIAIFLMIWATGELAGYTLGEGGSSLKVV